MGKSGGGEQYVTSYHMSMHLGVCAGPVDAVRDVKIGEKSISIPVQTDTGYLDIDKKEIFGGPKKGGGVAGRIHFLFGKSDQYVPMEMALKHGRLPTTMSGYRDLLTLFFQATEGPSGPDGGVLGFLWGDNQPVVPKISVTATRRPKVLDASNALVGLDANPAHIIAECLVDEDFGVGYEPWRIGDSFYPVAQRLFTEGFGLSYFWSRSTPIEQFINEVLHTISANLIFDITTGKWEIILLRADYQSSVLPEINPSNARLVSFERKGWGETINEIVLTWTNPQNEKEDTITIQNNAAVQTQNSESISDSSRNYPGIRSFSLAYRVAERDLRQASAPLASVTANTDRRFWKTPVGGVVKFRWPENEITKPLIMRVVKVAPGKRGSPQLTITLLEDIFSFGVSPVESTLPEIDAPEQDPIDVLFAHIESMPYYMLANLVGDSAASQVEYPVVHTRLLAATRLLDIRDIDTVSEYPDPTGSLAFQESATIDEPGLFFLDAPLAAAVRSTLTRPLLAYRNLTTGGFLIIKDANFEEICAIESIDGLNLALRRGCLDTVPRDWLPGAQVWVVNANLRLTDQTDRADGEEVRYKFLPITSKSRLPEDSATIRTGLLDGRPYLPLRPANIRVNGVGIPAIARVGSTGAVPGHAVLTWSNRNRLTETAIVLSWDDDTVDPEEGQSTTIVVRDEFDTVISTVTDVAGNSFNLTHANMGNPSNGDRFFVELIAERDDYESRESARITVDVAGENLMDYSHDFSQWGALAGQVSNVLDGPISGTLGASKITSRASPETVHWKLRLTPVLTLNQTYTALAVLNASEISDVRMYMNKGGFTTVGRRFNLAGAGADTAFAGQPVAHGMEALGDGWFLCWFSFVATVADSLNFIIRLGYSDFTGNGVDGVCIDHVQLESGAAPSGFFIRKP